MIYANLIDRSRISLKFKSNSLKPSMSYLDCGETINVRLIFGGLILVIKRIRAVSF